VAHRVRLLLGVDDPSASYRAAAPAPSAAVAGNGAADAPRPPGSGDGRRSINAAQE